MLATLALSIQLSSYLSEYYLQGLRTLVIASRELSDAEFKDWQSIYEEGST